MRDQESIELRKTPVLWWFIAASSINFMVAFCVSEYFNHQTFASIMSFNARDEPGPLEPFLYTTHAPFGQHYFGDFFQILQMSKLPTPYLNGNNNLISQYPPISHMLFYPLKLIDTKLAVLAYLLISLILVVWTIRKLTEMMDLTVRPLVFLLFLFSGPVISIIDRGNITLVIFSLTVLSLFVVMNDFNKVIVQILSIGMKFFPAFFFMEVEKKQQSRNVFRTGVIEALAILCLSSLGFLLLGSGFTQNIRGFFGAFMFQGRFSEQAFTQGVSLSAFMDAIQRLLDLKYEMATMLIVVVSTLFLLLLLLAQYLPRLSSISREEERLLIICSFICVVPKITGSYQLIFFLIPLALYLKKDLDSEKLSLNTFLLIFLILPIRYEISDGVFLSSLVAAPCIVVMTVNTFWIQVERAKKK